MVAIYADGLKNPRQLQAYCPNTVYIRKQSKMRRCEIFSSRSNRVVILTGICDQDLSKVNLYGGTYQTTDNQKMQPVS